MTVPSPRDYRPIYIQIAETLRARIMSRVYEERIDGELKLAREFDASRRTIQQALDLLVRDGLLVRQQGAGTFVNRRGVETRYRAIASITEGIAGQSLRPTYRILESGAEPGSAAARAFLGVGSDQHLYRHRRLVSADGKPVAIADTWLNLPLLEALDLSGLGESLYSFIRRRYGRTIVRAEDVYRPAAADPAAAALLGFASGSPVFHASRRGYDQSGTALELSEVTLVPVGLEISIYQVGSEAPHEPPPVEADPWRYRVGFGDF